MMRHPEKKKKGTHTNKHRQFARETDVKKLTNFKYAGIFIATIYVHTYHVLENFRLMPLPPSFAGELHIDGGQPSCLSVVSHCVYVMRPTYGNKVKVIYDKTTSLFGHNKPNSLML